MAPVLDRSLEVKQSTSSSARPTSAERSISPQPPPDWNQAVLDADAVADDVGRWLLSDAAFSIRLWQAASQYDQTEFCSIMSQLLQNGIQKFKADSKKDRREGRDIWLKVFHYLDINHEAVSEWLFSQFDDGKKLAQGKALHFPNKSDRKFAKAFFQHIEDCLSDRLSTDSPMQYIKSTIEALQDEDTGDAIIRMTWDPTKFTTEMDDSQSLGSMITFTGSVNAAWATTSREYVEKMWPKSGLATLVAIENIMKSKRRRHVFDSDSAIKLADLKDDGSYAIQIQGSRNEIVQITQQLAWMMSTFQVQEEAAPIQNVCSHLRIEYLDENEFLLEQAPLKAAPDSHASCWLPMLHGSVIAQGFPIPPRGQEKGVEMSLTAITILAGIEYPVYAEGVTFLKGWSTLLYPVCVSDDFGSIQWHYVQSDDPDDVRLRPNKVPVKNLANWKDVGIESIRKSRSFVGYCSRAKIYLGAESFEPQVPEEKSGASPVRSQWLWRNKITFSMGTSGMGIAGAGAGGEIGLSKKSRASIAESSNSKKALTGSAHRPVIIYDVATSTGWLVPEINVVLHLTRSWLIERGDLSAVERNKIPSATVTGDGGMQPLTESERKKFVRSVVSKNINAALSVIQKNKDLDLISEEGETWQFREIVKDALKVLRACRETQNREESSESGSWLFSWFHSPRLYGWDMADMVEGRESIPRKELVIRENSKSPWLSTIANHPDVLVLFCNNIKPPIRPAETEQVCRKWDPMPPGQNYLVASVHALQALASYCNGSASLRKLTDKSYWIQPLGSDPWTSCDFKSTEGCDRLQNLGDRASNRTSRVCEEGAVIFGMNGPRPGKCKRPRGLGPNSRKVASTSIARNIGGKQVRSRKTKQGEIRSGRPRPDDSATDTDEGLSPAAPSNDFVNPDCVLPRKEHRKQSLEETNSDINETFSSEESSHPDDLNETSGDSAADSNDQQNVATQEQESVLTENEQVLLTALATLEEDIKEGWKLYYENNGEPKTDRIRALIQYMSATIKTASDDLDTNAPS
ncbi:MAG: hypothetical protein Q9195_005466 [Heterodermia aff. obscurata]